MELVQESGELMTVGGDVFYSGRHIKAVESRVLSCGHSAALTALIPLPQGVPDLAQMATEERAFIEREVGHGMDCQAKARCPECQTQGGGKT